METAIINARVVPELKQHVFERIKNNGIPLSLRQPNEETIAALKAARSEQDKPVPLEQLRQLDLTALQLVLLKSFVKDRSKVKLTNKHLTRFVEHIYLLSQEKAWPAAALDHAHPNEWEDFREFPISDDVLLIYRVEGASVKLVRIGSYSQLFG